MQDKTDPLPAGPEAASDLGACLAQLRRVDALRAEGRLQDAQRACRAALCDDPGSAALHHRLAMLHRAFGDRTGVVHLRRAAALDPQNPDVQRQLGNVLRERGELTAALAAYRRAITGSPGSDQNHYQLGQGLAMAGRSAEAATALRRAVHCAPGFQLALGALARHLETLGRPDEAAECYGRLLALDPADSTALARRAETLLGAGRHGDGAMAYCEAILLGAAP